MPLFEYRCTACGRDFELLLLGSVQPACPHCQSAAVEKKFGAFAVVSRSRADATPDCAARCAQGYEHGTCGSGLCGGH
jgi:putative FmdB family regulatory protein